MADLAYAREQRSIVRSARVQATALVLATALFLGSGLFAADRLTNSIDELLDSTATARRQAEATRSILSSVKDAETEQRGYLLTGREIYLEPYQAANGRVEERLAALATLARTEPWLQAEQAELAAATRAKIDELEQAVTLARQQGLPAAIAVVNTEAGRQRMLTLRAVVARIVDRAERERTTRANRLRQREQEITTLFLTGLGAGLVLLGAAALLLVWNRMRLRMARNGERREATRLQVAVEHVPDGVAVFDREARLAIANIRFAPSLGIDPVLARRGTPFASIAGSAALDPPLLADPYPRDPSTNEAHQAGRSLQVWRSALPDGGQIVAVADISRRVAAEDAARQSQKMDVLGQMTGGVAHDFNNLLQVVSANLELLRNRLEQTGGNEALLARLDAASGGVARGARLTRHLLAFARRQPLAPEPLDAARLLMGLEDMLRRTVGEGIQLELVIGGGLWFMRADPTQFENALLNLALNARDAMTAPDGTSKGKLTIEAANAALDEAYAARAADVSPGQYLMFALTDTGPGMTPEQCARAIEPFYTTKPEGRGTGLGLPMVLGFAKQSNGHFQLYSEPGRGTTARLYIPRTTAPTSRIEPRQTGAPSGQNQLVLLVEDDAAVRQVAHEALTTLNYQVVEAESADAALVLLRAGCRPQVLFTDVVMPGQVSARDMAAQAQAMLPGLRVLFTSGYTQNSIVHNGQLDADVALISKPWRQEDLARALRSVLDGTATRPPPRRRVLLVEDDKLLRMTTADALAELGFEVTEAATAAGALTRLQPPPDLLLTDFALSDQDGMTLAGAARERIPGLPVVLSGQSGPPPAHVVWLAKPYDVPALKRAVEQALA